MKKKKTKHVFIIGSKGIPAKYGGFETFVDKLTEYKKDENIQYHIACMNADKRLYIYNDAWCFNVNVPNIGPAKAVYYDFAALKQCMKYIIKNRIDNAIIYVLACRIGPFIGFYKKKMKQQNVELYVNPDGHEWLRKKWNWIIKKYWKLSERLMVKNSDLLICDSKNIQKYIQREYDNYYPKTVYIAYGAEVSKSLLKDDDKKLLDWNRKFNLKSKNYYLAVGRFVPENNYETMIREFMKTKSKKDFVLVTNVLENKFYKKLKSDTGFQKDKRIKFVGTVYDEELLKKIRENAYGYFHGHEVGGTNPSLLEALGNTKLNLLLDVGFNREVAEDAAFYWGKKKDQLAKLIDEMDNLNDKDLEIIGKHAKQRILECYNWDFIVKKYEDLFLD